MLEPVQVIPARRGPGRRGRGRGLGGGREGGEGVGAWPRIPRTLAGARTRTWSRARLDPHHVTDTAGDTAGAALAVLAGPGAVPRRGPRQGGHERRDPGRVAVGRAAPRANVAAKAAAVQQLQARQALVHVVQVRGVLVHRRRGRQVRRRQVGRRRQLRRRQGHVRGRLVGHLVGRRGGRPPQQTLAAPAAPVGQVLGVRHGHLLALVPDQLDGAPDLRGHRALEAALPQQRVDRLDAVPPLLGRHFREVGGGALGALLVVELDADAVHAHLPVQVVLGVLEVAQDGHRHAQARQLLARDGAEAGVSHGAGDSVFPKTTVQIHC